MREQEDSGSSESEDSRPPKPVVERMAGKAVTKKGQTAKEKLLSEIVINKKNKSPSKKVAKKPATPVESSSDADMNSDTEQKSKKQQEPQVQEKG